MPTQGTVTDYVIGPPMGYDASDTQCPVVEYCAGCTQFTLTGEPSYGRRKKIGAKVAVMFDPEHPSTAYLVADYYVVANWLLGIGGAFVLLGSYLVYELIC